MLYSISHKSTLFAQLWHSIVTAFTLQHKETVNSHGLLWNGGFSRGFSGFTVDLVDLIVGLVDLMLNPKGQGC